TWLIMNRPDKRNAMSPQLHLDMDDALDDLATDEETEILVLTGAGDEAFCAGQDIRLYFRGTQQDPKTRAKARRASNQWRWQRLSTFPKPTIAMVNGFCFGGGFTQVSACDFAMKLQETSAAALLYTKEAIRSVRFMNEPQAADYLNAKSDALKHNDKEDGRNQGMKQFLDDKSYRPGLGHFKRQKAAAK